MSKQLELLKMIIQQNGVNISEARKIYDSRKSAYRTLQRLENFDIVKKSEMPKPSKKRFVWRLNTEEISKEPQH